MPYISAEKRASGPYVSTSDRVLPVPDQSRYGTATDDPPPYNTDGTIKRA